MMGSNNLSPCYHSIPSFARADLARCLQGQAFGNRAVEAKPQKAAAPPTVIPDAYAGRLQGWLGGSLWGKWHLSETQCRKLCSVLHLATDMCFNRRCEWRHSGNVGPGVGAQQQPRGHCQDRQKQSKYLREVRFHHRSFHANSGIRKRNGSGAFCSVREYDRMVYCCVIISSVQKPFPRPPPPKKALKFYVHI